jgi:hypothetical protein
VETITRRRRPAEAPRPEGRQGMSENARRLLWAASDIRAKRDSERDGAEALRAGTDLPLAEAAECIGTFAGSLLYEAAVLELEYGGMIAPNPAAPSASSGMTFVLTGRGVRTLRDA